MNATTGNLPADAFVAGIDGQDQPLIACRTIDSENCPGYYDPAKGCTITRSPSALYFDTFQMLTGKGLFWESANNLNSSTRSLGSSPLKIGQDWTGDLYLGRSNIGNTAYLGKINRDAFYYNKNGTEANQSFAFVLKCKA